MKRGISCSEFRTIGDTGNTEEGKCSDPLKRTRKGHENMAQANLRNLYARVILSKKTGKITSRKVL